MSVIGKRLHKTTDGSTTTTKLKPHPLDAIIFMESFNQTGGHQIAENTFKAEPTLLYQRNQ
jgi:hypothetical protein